jgi:hypothetical protein
MATTEMAAGRWWPPRMATPQKRRNLAEGEGFELSVPLGDIRRIFCLERKCQRVKLGVSRGVVSSQRGDRRFESLLLRQGVSLAGAPPAGSARHPILASAPHSAPEPAAEISRLRREFRLIPYPPGGTIKATLPIIMLAMDEFILMLWVLFRCELVKMNSSSAVSPACV